MKTEFEHISVLADEVVDFAPQASQLILDCTLGGGGHSRRLLEKFPLAILYGIDRDAKALNASEESLKKYKEQIHLEQASFSELSECFEHWGEPRFDYILADIGLSSEQLSRPERGFSFMHEGPLDMRMDPERQHLTAADLVNHSSESELLKILRDYGEERFARKIVSTILAERTNKKFETTKELSDMVSATIPRRFQKPGFNPATLTFQALRIMVNDELNELGILLKEALSRLKPDGRLAIISFHSLEDRMVKHQFRKWENPCVCPTDLPYCICGEKPLGQVITKRPINASTEETSKNPRSRSAHLRVFSSSQITHD